MLFDGGFSFSNFLVDVLAVFMFVVWFWLLITVFGDLFRRHDISGWGKALWVIALIVFPRSKPGDELNALIVNVPSGVSIEQMWKLLGFIGPAVQVQ